MAETFCLGVFEGFNWPGCDIFADDLNLRLWQAMWEKRLTEAYGGTMASTISRPFDQASSERILSEGFARQQQTLIKATQSSIGMIKHLLATDSWGERSVEEIWTRMLTRAQREELVMWAARDVCTLASIEEGLRDWVPELQLWYLAADEGRRFWSIVQTLAAPPTEPEFPYPRVRYAPYDDKMAEGFSKEVLPANRAKRAFQSYYMDMRHRFLSCFVARVLLHMHFNLKAERNLGRLIGAGDYLIKDDMDVQMGDTTIKSRGPKERSAGPPPDLATVLKRMANECSKCSKTRWFLFVFALNSTPTCGKLALDTAPLPTFIHSDSPWPTRTPPGLLRQIAAFEAEKEVFWTVGAKVLRTELDDLGWILDNIDGKPQNSPENSSPTATEDLRRSAIASVEKAACGDMAALNIIYRWMTMVSTVMTMILLTEAVKFKTEVYPVPQEISQLVMAQFRQDFEFTTDTMKMLVFETEKADRGAQRLEIESASVE
ncbi:hypothetical protein P7C70_g5329, partial [Phenoliferia sp. Uapishka_3]